jgi:adenylate kinase
LTTSTTTASTTAPVEKDFLPGPVLLLGAPGVGKGTQAKALMAAYGIPQISTGDILRANILNGTELGKEAKALMDKGQLVPDGLVNQMVWHKILDENLYKGFVLDGYPRTLAQADFIDFAINDPISPVRMPLVAISIVVDYEQLLHRITGRRICPAGHIFNIYSNPPKNPGICDVDGSALVQRPDDSEAVFTERMKTFEAQTAPVIEHYRKQGRFEEIDGDRQVEQVTAEVASALKRLRSSNE